MYDETGLPDKLLSGAQSCPGSSPEPLSVEEVRSGWGPVIGRLQQFGDDDIVTLVVNDATRPPSYRMLEPVEPDLRCSVRILFATGTHRPVTEAEKSRLMGELFPDASWRSNDCDAEDMVNIGRTSRGTPVNLDPWIFSGSAVLSVNSVEPHYFAGYTGGRKSFLPGVSARDTIITNHYRACLQGSAPGELDGNPVHLDMVEALGFLEDRVEIIQGNGVMHSGEPVYFTAGSCSGSFRRAVEFCAGISTLTVKKKSRVVVLHPGEPLDLNLYQSEKAIYNCHSLVDDGGVLLLISSCPEGLGADHMEKAFISSMDPDWTEPSSEQYRLGDHAILRLRNMRQRIRFAMASDLPDELLLRMGIEPVHDISRWLQDQRCAEPLFIQRAGFLVPEIVRNC